jgi:light-regulated signal transduction histidine kinase (bacteriophytochrome)
MVDWNLETDGGQERLLWALAEHLKLPLLQISHRAELSRRQPATETLRHIEDTASLALKLIDNYLLSSRLRQTALELEPVSLSAVMHDASLALQPLARQYGCNLDLQLNGKYGPVMTHAGGLSAALLSLGQVFIEAGSRAGNNRHTVIFATNRSRGGITAGIFSDTEQLTADIYRRARQLYGRARQPLQGLTSASAAGVFVADSLLDAMSAPLRVASHRNTKGLAATFLPSQQLSLV